MKTNVTCHAMCVLFLHVAFFGMGENEPRMHLSSQFFFVFFAIQRLLIIYCVRYGCTVAEQSSCKKIHSVSACVICEKYFLSEIHRHHVSQRNAFRSYSVRIQCVFFLSVRGDPDVLLLPFKYLRTCSRSCKTLRLCGSARAHISMCSGFKNNLSMCDARFIWRIWDYRSSCRFNAQRSVM